MNLLNIMKQDSLWGDGYTRFLSKRNISTNNAEVLTNFIYSNDIREQMLQDIEQGNFRWSTPKKLELSKEGSLKKRVVYLYNIKERLLQRVIYEALNMKYEHTFSKVCFSYRPRTTIINAVEYLLKTRDITKMYSCKLDIRAYFNSVNKENLFKMLNDILYDEPQIKKLLIDLYDNENVIHKGRIIREYMSLIPGTPLASFLSNYLLKDLDNYFETRGISYARYCDDIIVFGETKEILKGYINYITNHINEYGLTINQEKLVFTNPYEQVTFLGLKLTKNKVDMSEESFKKMKKFIKHEIKRSRIRLEKKGLYKFDAYCTKSIRKINYKVYKVFTEDANKFGWGYFMFRYINCVDTLRELDFYYKDMLRYLKTGKYNKANIAKFSEEDMRAHGWVSFCEMYIIFKTNFEAYVEKCSLMK